MSDLSALEQAFALPSAGLAIPAQEPPPASTDILPDEVAYCRLRGAHEIAAVLHLRRQIALPVSALGDAGFALREKKEMRSAWSAPSSAREKPSAPSATCR